MLSVRSGITISTAYSSLVLNEFVQTFQKKKKKKITVDVVGIDALSTRSLSRLIRDRIGHEMSG